ncbi:MAG: AarF/ABC1/UbiB kinase family protein [Bacteroidetes bacterium]|nr:AarF/ABC1/UbiB kinase family protein [Bacteroidota bacterium]
MGFLSYIDGKYSYIRRYNQIIRVLFRYGFEDFVSYMEERKRFTWIKNLIPKSTYEHALHLTKWERMRLVCEELGPTFVKFGQLMSNRPDILPSDLIKELEKLQDNVYSLSAEVASLVVEQELKTPPRELFEWFEPEAFASASIAQVHRAILKTGEKVVVKIQRPEIQHTIEQDIKVMLYVAEIFNRRIPSLKSFDPIGLVRNFEMSIMKELDFIHESVNVQRFHNNFLEDETDKGYIHSPKVYREFTTSKVLTLEYIDGIKISDMGKLQSNGLDRKLIAKRLAVSYFKQVFNYGFFHADPHPGNLFVLPENVICYIDYGMMGSIMTNDIEQFGNLFLAVRAKDVRRIIRSIQQLSDNPIVKNFRELETDLNDFVQNYSIETVHENELSTVLLELKDIIVKHGLKVPAHFFLIARSMVTVEGVIRQLDSDLDLEKMARPYFIRTVAKHYNPVKFVKRVFNSIYEIGMYMEDFPRDMKNAIRRINTGEIKVDLRHKGIDPLVHTFNRLGKQIISAVIMASFIIGSSMMVVYHVTPLWGTTSVFGIFGFTVATLIALSMIKDMRKGDHDDWAGWES